MEFRMGAMLAAPLLAPDHWQLAHTPALWSGSPLSRSTGRHGPCGESAASSLNDRRWSSSGKASAKRNPLKLCAAGSSIVAAQGCGVPPAFHMPREQGAMTFATGPFGCPWPLTLQAFVSLIQPDCALN